jgi:hypothetical protein
MGLCRGLGVRGEQLDYSLSCGLQVELNTEAELQELNLNHPRISLESQLPASLLKPSDFCGSRSDAMNE